MESKTASETPLVRLQPFEPLHAATIAEWISTAEELRWLAPSTTMPLTPGKVASWKKESGQAFVLMDSQLATPLGYGELNPMRRAPSHFWLGHIIVAPNHRGRGLGRLLVDKLVHFAFKGLKARRISLIVFPDNTPAIDCYLTIGFKQAGVEFHQFGGRGPKRKLLRFHLYRGDVGYGPVED